MSWRVSPWVYPVWDSWTSWTCVAISFPIMSASLVSHLPRRFLLMYTPPGPIHQQSRAQEPPQALTTARACGLGLQSVPQHWWALPSSSGPQSPRLWALVPTAVARLRPRGSGLAAARVCQHLHAAIPTRGPSRCLPALRPDL